MNYFIIVLPTWSQKKTFSLGADLCSVEIELNVTMKSNTSHFHQHHHHHHHQQHRFLHQLLQTCQAPLVIVVGSPVLLPKILSIPMQTPVHGTKDKHLDLT